MEQLNSTCGHLHQKAMHQTKLALKAERLGNAKTATNHFQKAFDLEMQAAMTLAYQFELEPSRSVLFRGASFLTIKAKKYREVERMAAFGLIGNPPLEIANELREALNESLEYLKLVA